MEMNAIVGVIFVLAIAALVGYNALKSSKERSERRAEMKSIQDQITKLTEKLKSLNLFKG